MNNNSYIDFIKEKEGRREDKDNIYCTGITDKEFVNFINDENVKNKNFEVVEI